MRLPVLAALAVFSVGSAALAAPDDSFELRDDGSVVFDGVSYPSASAFYRSQAFRDSGLRCGSTAAAPPVADFSPTHCSLSATSIQPDYEPDNGPAYQISVVVHVISASDGTGDLSEALIQSQIDILNEDFRALAGSPGADGTDSRIQFALASTDPAGNPTTGIVRYVDDVAFEDSSQSFKKELSWDTNRYFNMFTFEAGNGLLGEATFPAQSAGLPEDGIVVNWQTFGRNAPLEPYDQGRTTTHEVGHYLGLYHTFQSGCDQADPYTSGDRIADTPDEAQQHFGCDPGTTTCGSPDAIDNYMNYTDDLCMERFTPEQINRMRCSISNYRLQLINEIPAIDFDFEPAEKTIAFTDNSVDNDGTIVSRQWDFGDGSTSTEKSLTHTYDEFGLYDVTLTVVDDLGGVATLTVPIAANILPVADFSTSGGPSVSFKDKSTDANGMIVAWEWDFGDGETSTEQNPAHDYAMEGVYTVTFTATDDLGGTATVTREIDASEGGCLCTASGGGVPWGEAGLFVLALALIRRRRRWGYDPRV
jgi:PKD repeat protein